MANELAAGWSEWINSNGSELNGGDAEEATASGKRRGRITGITLRGNEVIIQLAYVAVWDGRARDWYVPRNNPGDGIITFNINSVMTFDDRLATAPRAVSITTNNSVVMLHSNRSDKLIAKPDTR